VTTASSVVVVVVVRVKVEVSKVVIQDNIKIIRDQKATTKKERDTYMHRVPQTALTRHR
jgi:hypothetical protein